MQAKVLFGKHWDGNPVRLLGVTATGLQEVEHAVKQLDLFSFEKEAENEQLFQTLSKLQKKYGKGIIRKANRYGKKVNDQRFQHDTSFNRDFLQEKNYNKE